MRQQAVLNAPNSKITLEFNSTTPVTVGDGDGDGDDVDPDSVTLQLSPICVDVLSWPLQK